MPLINRYSTIQRGAIIFTGNTLGLAGYLASTTPFPSNTTPPLLPGPGAVDSIGTFITTQNLQAAGGWPVGTTNNYLQNSSSAQVNIMPGSTVLYAELVWSGIIVNQNANLLANINNAVKLTTPAGTTAVTPDPITTSSFLAGGSGNTAYVASQNVTALVQAGGSGTYTVGEVPGVLGNSVNSVPPFNPPNNVTPQNFLGWTLQIVYRNDTLPIRNMDLWVNDDLINAGSPPLDITVSGLATATTGVLNGKLFLSSGEGDANIVGDQALFGPNVGSLTNIGNIVVTPNPNPGTTPNNPSNNFFGSQVNGDNGLLDTTGTFGLVNQNEFLGVNVSAARQGWDIATVDVSATLLNSQTSAVIRLTTVGDAYINNAVGLQVNALEPIFDFAKVADKTIVNIGDTVTYTSAITNISVINADNVIFTDTPPIGSSFIVGSVKIDGVTQGAENPSVGINLGTIIPSQTVIVEFKVNVDSLPATPPSPPQLNNIAVINYTFVPVVGTTLTGTDTTPPVITEVVEPSLAVNKSVDKQFANLDDTIIYKVTIENTGALPLNNVQFQDLLPSGVTYVIGSLTVDAVFTGTDPQTGLIITTINPNQIVTITWSVKIGATLPSPNPIPNIGTVTVAGLTPINTNQVTTQVNYADVTITKSVDKTETIVGDMVTYTVTVTNTGNVDANPAMLTDIVPNGASFIVGSLIIDNAQVPGDPNVGVNVGPIAPGQSKTIIFTVDVNILPIPNPMPNTANIAYEYLVNPTGNTTAVNKDSNTVFTAIGIAQISKSVDKEYADLGEVITYTAILNNNGVAPVNNVLFQDSVPSGTTYINGSLSVTSVPSGVVFLGTDPQTGISIPTVASGQIVTISWKVQVGNNFPIPNPILNSATVSADGLNPVNTNTVATQVNHVDLAIIKAVDKTQALVGEIVTYTIDVTNNGNTNANPVIITDIVPNGTSYVSGTLTIDGNPNPGDLNSGVNIGPIAPGQTNQIKFSVVINVIPNPNPMQNTATANFEYIVNPITQTPTQGTITSNTVDTAVGDLVINKAVDKVFVDLGEIVNYTVILQNTGIVTLNNVAFQDQIPVGTNYVNGSLVVDTTFTGTTPQGGIIITTINPSQIVTITWKVQVGNEIPNPNPIPNIGIVTIAGLAPINTNQVTSQVNNATIIQVKTVDKTSVAVGDTLTYTVTVANTGNVVANPVTITDVVPNGTSYVPGSLTVNTIPNGADPNTGVQVGPIAAGEIVPVTFTVNVNTLPNPNPLVNTALANYQYQVNPSSVPVSASNTSNPVTTPVGNIVGVKSVSPEFIDLGELLTYTVTLTNSGLAPIINVAFLDTIPSGTSYADTLVVTGSGFTGTDPQTGLIINSVNPGQPVTISWQVQVGNTIPNPNPIENIAIITTPGLPPITTNSVTVPVNNATIIQVKTVDKTSVAVGDTLTYTVTVANTGNMVANPVTITDVVPNGTSYVPGSLTVNTIPNGADPNTGVQVGPIAAGEIVPVTFTVNVDTLPNPNPLINTALANYQYQVNPSSVPVSASNTSNPVTTPVGNIVGVKSVSPEFIDLGELLTYTVTLTNSGLAPIINVAFLDTIPSGTSYAGALVVTGSGFTGIDPETGLTINSVNPGQPVTISWQVQVGNTIPNPNPIENIAIITTPGLPSITTNSVTVPVNNATIIQVKTVDKTSVAVGDTLTYTVTVANTGSVVANPVTITDVVPNGTSYVPGSLTVNTIPNGADPNTGVQVGPIAAGQIVPVTFTVNVNTLPNPNPMINTALANYQYQVNPSSVPVSASNTSNPVTTPVGNIVGVKSVSPEFIDLGQLLTYTVTLTNSGLAPIINVAFLDTIPSGTSYADALVVTGSGFTGTDPQTGLTINSVNPGQPVAISWQVQVGNTIPNPSVIPNTAQITVSGTIPNPTNTVTTQVNNADLVSPGNFVKSRDLAFANVGDEITYSINITNTGNTIANNVVITDPIPSGTSYVAGSLVANEPITGTPEGGINVTNGIAPGATLTLSYKVHVDVIPGINPIPNTASVKYNYTVDPAIPNGASGSGNTNTVTTQVNNADLVAPGNFVKSRDLAFANVLDEITYTINVTNTGNTIANNVVITDPIPSGTSYVAGSLVANESITGTPEGGINVTNGIAPGATLILSYKVHVDVIPVTNPIPNTASVNYTYTVNPASPNGVSGSGNTNTVTTQVNNADLVAPGNFVKSRDLAFANVLDVITYTINVKNTGNTIANNVVITDPIPSGTSYVVGSLTANEPVTGTPEGGINVTNGIAPGATLTLSYKVHVDVIPSINPIPNTASVKYNYTVDPAIPNGASGSGNTNTVTTQVNNANLVAPGNFVKSTNNQFADVGNEITYTINVTNTGNIIANNVVINDPIPNGTSYVGGSLTSSVAVTGTPAAGINVTNGVAPGQTVILTYRVKVDQVPTPNPIPNTASVNYTYTVNPANPNEASGSGNTNTVTTQVNHGEILPQNTIKSVDKTVTTHGDVLTYTVTAENTGNVPINVVVTDVVPIGTQFVTGTVIVNGISKPAENPNLGINVGTIPASGTVTVIFKVTVLENAPSILINSANVRYSYIVDPSLPAVTKDTPTNTVSTTVLKSKLTLNKLADRTGAVVGDIVRYSITATNTGEVPLQNVIVTDALEAELSYADNLTINGVPSNQSILTGVNIGSLALGEGKIIAFDAKVISIPADKTINNTSAATFDYNVSGNKFSGTSESNEETVAVFNPKLNVIKAASKTAVKVGDTFNYIINVANAGDIAINNVIVTDTLPAVFNVLSTAVDGISVSGDIQTGINIGTIDVGQNKYVVLTIQVISDLSDIYKNVADASGTATTDPIKPPTKVAGQGTDDVGVQVFNPQLSLIKSVDKPYAVVGEIVTYTIVAKNTGDIVLGNVALSPVTIFDILSPSLVFRAGSITINGISDPLAGIVSGVDIGVLGVGVSKTVTFQAEVISNVINPITNTSNVIFGFKLPGYPPEIGNSKSNVVNLVPEVANIDVIKTADKDFVVLGDTINYTVALKNTGTLDALNVIFKDALPNTVELINGSFSVNGTIVNGVNIISGVNIGTIKVKATTIVKYSVKVIKSNCELKIINQASVKFNYTLPDGRAGTTESKPTPASSVVITLGISNFKQLSVEENLIIPTQKPDIEEIGEVTGEIKIIKSHIIKTPTLRSNEGQNLTGYKLVVHGVIEEVVEYTALDEEQSVHSAHYSIPFTTFIVLPENYCNLGNIEINPIIEDIYYKQLDNRSLFVNATILIKATVSNC